MGNCGSKPEVDAGAAPRRARQQARGDITISAPQEVMIHVPRNRVDRYGAPLQQVTREIDRGTLLAALAHVANYVAQRGQGITVVAVGGAVNTLHLQSRHTTHDVDIFGAGFTNDARVLLDEAMHDAQRHYGGLGTDWLNTETQMWMPGPVHQQLTSAAMKQNVKVFDMPGLTIYAAPWSYAFSAKINRLLTGGAQTRPYDLDDAVSYIHEYIHSHGGQPVNTSIAIGWARHFHHESTPEFLQTRVNQAYRRQYGRDAFV